MESTQTLKKPTLVPFFRMTVLGMTGSGKTAFINAFVNSQCPNRYTSTDKVVLYYKLLETRDEGEYDVLLRPNFIEIEDTPGSEKGPGGVSAAPPDDADNPGPPEVKRGARVQVLKEKNKVIAMFNSEEWRMKCEYKKAMDGMLGKEYTVKIMPRDGTVGLPSPDGSEGGVWNFPFPAVSLKTTPEVPLDKFLSMKKSIPHLPKDPNEKKEIIKKFELPFSAYERKIGPVDVDKALTRNRMGFFICFDLAEEDNASLKEAMNIHAQLKKNLKAMQKQGGVMNPVVFLIGTKADKTSAYEAIDINTRSAKMFSDQEDIKLINVSAKTNLNVNEAFQSMVDQIQSRASLWAMDSSDDPTMGDDEGASYCPLS